MAGTKPNGISIQSLLNPISLADCNILGSRSAEGHQEFSKTSEESSKKSFVDDMDNKECSLNVGELVGDGELVEREPQACSLGSRSLPGRITSGDSHCSQGSNISQKLPSPNNADGNDNDVQVPGSDSGGCHNLPVPSQSGPVRNLNPDRTSAAMQSIWPVDSPVLQRTSDCPNLSSPQYTRDAIPNGGLGEQFCHKPKVTKRRKYLKRIGVPRYRTSSPLQPFSRRLNHRQHPIASNLESFQPPNMWRSSPTMYPTSPALAEPVALTHPSRAHESNVYEHASPAVPLLLPEPSFLTSAGRSTFGAMPNPQLYIVTDPSGFTFCTFQPPMNISPDFLVYQYPSTANMASSHVHIVHRQ